MAVLSVGGCIQTFVRDRLCWNPRVSFLLKPLSCHSIDQSLWGEGGGKKKKNLLQRPRQQNVKRGNVHEKGKEHLSLNEDYIH